MKLSIKQLRTLIQEQFETANKTMTNAELEQKHPEAYAALPSSYQNDRALTFSYDVNGNLCAEHDLGGEYLWVERKQKWVEIG